MEEDRRRYHVPRGQRAAAWSFALTGLIVMLFSPVVQAAQSTPLEPVTVERVIDGDTFVASGRKIRIWGIDAPERGAELYQIATLYLETILKSEPVRCRLKGRDPYRRDVMQCTADGLDIASQMVQMGLAIDFEKYSHGYYSGEEDVARSAHRGLWKREGEF